MATNAWAILNQDDYYNAMLKSNIPLNELVSGSIEAITAKTKTRTFDAKRHSFQPALPPSVRLANVAKYKKVTTPAKDVAANVKVTSRRSIHNSPRAAQ